MLWRQLTGPTNPGNFEDMSHTLSVPVPDDLYRALEACARREKLSIEELALREMTRGLRQVSDVRTEQEKEAARQALRAHFGSVSLGKPSIDSNEALDKVLGDEYANPHDAHAP
ncbi:MAG: hypothetical protein U0793_02970 [Gemmataceae bacterium]